MSIEKLELAAHTITQFRNCALDFKAQNLKLWSHGYLVFMFTVENCRFDRCILDWTNQCKSHLPLVAKSAFLQTATAAHIPGPIYETFLCSSSLKPGSFGYLGQKALALIGPI